MLDKIWMPEAVSSVWPPNPIAVLESTLQCERCDLGSASIKSELERIWMGLKACMGMGRTIDVKRTLEGEQKYSDLVQRGLGGRLRQRVEAYRRKMSRWKRSQQSNICTKTMKQDIEGG